MGHEEVMPTSPPLLENGPTMSPAESDDGENRQAAISKLRRKHTPHVVTEAIVNDHLRPKLPKVSSKKNRRIKNITRHVLLLHLIFPCHVLTFGRWCIVGSIIISVPLNPSSVGPGPK